MMKTLIGGVYLEEQSGRTYGVDMRVYRWLEQWLTEDEARRLVFSMAYQRLVKLVARFYREIAAMEVFNWQGLDLDD